MMARVRYFNNVCLGVLTFHLMKTGCTCSVMPKTLAVRSKDFKTNVKNKSEFFYKYFRA